MEQEDPLAAARGVIYGLIGTAALALLGATIVYTFWIVGG